MKDFDRLRIRFRQFGWLEADCAYMSIKRERHIDLIKGCAIASVVMVHSASGSIPPAISSILGYPWQVPMFFIISGLFLNIGMLEDTGRFLKKKLLTLYVPTTLLYLCMILLHNVFVDIGWYQLGRVHYGNGIPFHYYSIKEFIFQIVKTLFGAGSGELAMGAIWFVYVLLYAFFALAVVARILKRVSVSTRHRFGILFIIGVLAGAIGMMMSLCFGITINRVNITGTAMMLIVIGMLIGQAVRWAYDSKKGIAVATVVFLLSVVGGLYDPLFQSGYCNNIFILVCGCSSLMYIWGFVGKRLEGSHAASAVEYLGRHSYCIMALHTIGIFACNSLLEWIGVFDESSPMGMYAYRVYNNVFLLLLYMLMGISVPLILREWFYRLCFKMKKMTN